MLFFALKVRVFGKRELVALLFFALRVRLLGKRELVALLFFAVRVIILGKRELDVQAALIRLIEAIPGQLYEPAYDKINKMACVPSEDSDKPGWISLGIRPV